MTGRFLRRAGLFLASTALVASAGGLASAQQNQRREQRQQQAQQAPVQQDRMAARQQRQQQAQPQIQQDRMAAMQQRQQQAQQAQIQQDRMAAMQQRQQQAQQAQIQQDRQAARQQRQQQAQQAQIQQDRQTAMQQRQQQAQQAQIQQDRQAARQQRQQQAQQAQQAQIQQDRQAARQQRQQAQQAQVQQDRQAARQQRQQQAQLDQQRQFRPGGQQTDGDRERRISDFRGRWTDRERQGLDRERWFRDHGRIRGSRFEEEYLEHLRQDRFRVAFIPSFYYYNAPQYRFFFNGGYSFLDGYGADSLRQAVQYGYQEGFRAGQSDQLDGAPFGYNESFAYQDASWGYAGYCDLTSYQYYFRQGFLRGYQDGFSGTYQYGVYSGGVANILGNVLLGIFNPQPY